MPKKKQANKSEREHMDRVTALGCIVCFNDFGVYTPAEYHHIANGAMGKRAGHKEGIPLCPQHHRNGGYGVAVHAGRKVWEKKHGTEKQLLKQILEMLVSD